MAHLKFLQGVGARQKGGSRDEFKFGTVMWISRCRVVYWKKRDNFPGSCERVGLDVLLVVNR